MVIPDSDLPPRITKSDEDESEEESETDSEEENHDDSLGGRVRTVSVIATGAQPTVPVVAPARGRKSTLYQSEKVFEEFDNQAIEVCNVSVGEVKG